MCRKPFKPPEEKDDAACLEPALGRKIRMRRREKSHDLEMVQKLAQEIYDNLQTYRNSLRYV